MFCLELMDVMGFDQRVTDWKMIDRQMTTKSFISNRTTHP